MIRPRDLSMFPLPHIRRAMPPDIAAIVAIENESFIDPWEPGVFLDGQGKVAPEPDRKGLAVTVTYELIQFIDRARTPALTLRTFDVFVVEMFPQPAAAALASHKRYTARPARELQR